MVNLVLTRSYYNLFPVLTNRIQKNALDLSKKNLVFCEAKVSLMIERFLCAKTGGSFNTDVYSFGNFLRAKKPIDKLLSKEGSAMAIKRILSEIKLQCFKQSKANLAPTLYDLIIQLKSAKITPDDVLAAAKSVKGILKNKLADIGAVYFEYEKYIEQNGFEDQSSLLSYLPEIIETDKDIASSDVYVVGYGGFTAQMRAAVTALIKKANSVTAILVEGENSHVYVNETAQFIREECRRLHMPVIETFDDGDFNGEAQIIADNLFSPTVKLRNKNVVNTCGKYQTDKIYFYAAKNPADEIERVAGIIRKAVLDGDCRFRDITVTVPDLTTYGDYIKATFERLNVPCFLDEQKVPLNHPLITLIVSYIDAQRKGLERGAFSAFFKNPLFCADKKLTDALENYLIKYNINYGRIKNNFTFPATDEDQLIALEDLRRKAVNLFEDFNVLKMLSALSVKDGLNNLSEKLRAIKESEEAAVTDQIYDAVIGLIGEMQMMLGEVGLSLTEYKNVFLSGVSAMKLSVIPQYNDAVFVGGFKETALAKAKYLFVTGLTVDVPSVQADVALLSDGDISALEQIKMLVEPKIRVVNHRTRENVGMALAAFDKRLYLSYPTANTDGKKNIKSEVLTCIEKLFTIKNFPIKNGYLTYAQGLNTFARACGEFAEGKTENDFSYDFTLPSSFYAATGGEKLKPLLDGANKEVKVRLSGNKVSLIKGVISPTAIEDYYRCPYRAFISHALKIKERDEGQVNVLSVGNLMHEILNKYVDGINAVTDNYSSDALFESAAEKILSRDEYKKFIDEPSTKATISRVLKECKGYCYKTYLSLKKSAFDKSKTEVAFGDFKGAEYPAIPLLGGEVKLKGKIDRVDESKKYFRVIDYKTGKTDPSEKALFAGVKLQLYLYAAAVLGKYKGDSAKFPAGLYYLPVSDKYEKPEDKGGALAVGKTLSELDAISVQDFEFSEKGETDFTAVKLDGKSGKIKNGVDRGVLQSYVDYALKASEAAVKNMSDGVIVASPYENACEYCEYSALCGVKDATPRSVGTVDESTFNADKGGERNA